MRAIFQLVSAAWAAVVLPLSLMLFTTAATWTGRLFAVASLAIAVAPALFFWGRKETRRGRARIASVLLVFFGFAFTGLFLRAPTGSAGRQAKIHHTYSNGLAAFDRFALGNVLPEVDQLMLGFTLATMWDPLLTRSQAAELKKATRIIYEELEADADFHALGSTMPEVYRSLMGKPDDAGHAYVLVPRDMAGDRTLRTIVFLHGAGGGFKGYLWVLKELADRSHAVVVAPTYGIGNWQTADVASIIQKSIETIPHEITIDLTDVHVMGLSNGGLGVSQLLRASPGKFKSLVFLSPVFDHKELDLLERVGSAKVPPILVLSGDRDDRIPPSYVEASAARLRAAGAKPTVRFIADANHFAIFTRRAELIDLLSEWLAKPP